MAVTRLKRKTRTNRTKYHNRAAKIKFLSSKPVLKNVDLEKIKEEFEKAKKDSVTKGEAAAQEKPLEKTPKVAEAKTTTTQAKAKEPAAQKPAQNKTEAGAKKPAAKKPTQNKTETVAKKPTAKKPTPKKAAAKKEDQ